jgi:hypothetical protein
MKTMRAIAVLTATFALAAPLFAADPPAKADAPKHNAVYLTAEEAGPDGAIQGEYEGAGGASGKWGAQVIAMGDGKFHGVFLPGGLPGAGWDAKTRFETEGALEGTTVTLHGVDKPAWTEGHFPPPGVEVKKGFDATITGDAITAKTDTGDAITLKRTVRRSPAEGAKAPQGATILFDGSNVDAWNNGKIIDSGPYKGTLKEGATTKKKYTDYTLHVEFLLPLKPWARQQERGNSGVYNQNRYETQVLDSFGVMGMDNQCGGVYTKAPPSVNMCYPPLTWQTYDIDFVAARYENGQKKSDAEITLKFNGVLVHDHFKINGPTGGGQKENPADAVQSGPLYLQNHGNPVFFKNVWIVERQ